VHPIFPRWWQNAVVYEIYPRSFADTNGDGNGDLSGIASKLDHLAWLGVDAIWIAPFYPSPMVDLGYDIADYTDVDSLFGTLVDFDELLAGAHERGIRVVIDYVPNHTSDAHPWFVESRSSRENRKRDWYIWRDPKPDGSPPNRWLSMFGAPPWTRDEATDQYYLHSFLPEQPDLNWRNPAVRGAMFDVARFWLDRGVDGFRIDVAPMVMKDPELRDNPLAPAPTTDELRHLGAWINYFHLYNHAHPDMHELYRSFQIGRAHV
jgi:alpha-glucosidase